MKITTIIGARPQFVKAAALSRAIRDAKANIVDEIIHTGQHYDENMSGVFFSELKIPSPINLNVGSATSHSEQISIMLVRLEKILIDSSPDIVVIYGDTNSTLAGALVANRLRLPIAHVEAGLRTYEKYIAEEVNRILADYVADWLYCPSLVSVQNLARESITKGVMMVGDVMYDVFLSNQKAAQSKSADVLERYGLTHKQFYLVTTHRAENTNNLDNLRQVMQALTTIAKMYPTLVPLHPRTCKVLAQNTDISTEGLKIVDPISYIDMLVLQRHCRLIVTDSGGVQKEAYWSGVPCVTMTATDCWTELTDFGCNTVVGPNTKKILDAVDKYENDGLMITAPHGIYGNGDASNKIAEHLLRIYGDSR